MERTGTSRSCPSLAKDGNECLVTPAHPRDPANRAREPMTAARWFGRRGLPSFWNLAPRLTAVVVLPAGQPVLAVPVDRRRLAARARQRSGVRVPPAPLPPLWKCDVG